MSQTNSAQFQSCSFTIPLGTKAHAIARKSSQAVCNTEKETDKDERVYRNCLAVSAVDFYLKFMGFETDIKQSNARDKLMLQFLSEADLPVTNIGSFECIPVAENADYGEISPDLSGDRIGYIFVQLSKSLREAVILGFSKEPSAKIDLNQLHSVDDLIDYLTDFEVEVKAKNLS